ncbi:MAG: PEP-CTERM sorting domain-containing protein [Akkermansia sp.]|nr:PEP-CTERM sorting domain-containing protein [Akkermansia sp.]
MKKTIITLMALAGVVMGDTEGDWKATFATSDKSYSQTAAKYTATFDIEAPLTLKFTDLAITAGTDSTNGTYSGTGDNELNPTSIRPNVNICKDSTPSNTYTLSFCVENKSQMSLAIANITLDAFGYNSTGIAHTAGTPKANFSLAYTLNENPFTITANEINVYSDATVNFDLENNAITLGAGEEVTFFLTVSRNDGNGSFVGLKSATFKVVPEPTTTTLSLLAMAGLAARRRRK